MSELFFILYIGRDKYLKKFDDCNCLLSILTQFCDVTEKKHVNKYFCAKHDTMSL